MKNVSVKNNIVPCSIFWLDYSILSSFFVYLIYGPCLSVPLGVSHTHIHIGTRSTRTFPREKSRSNVLLLHTGYSWYCTSKLHSLSYYFITLSHSSELPSGRPCNQLCRQLDFVSHCHCTLSHRITIDCHSHLQISCSHGIPNTSSMIAFLQETQKWLVKFSNKPTGSPSKRQPSPEQRSTM